MTSGTATVAAASMGFGGTAAAIPSPRGTHRIGEAEVQAVEEAVRRIRLLDDRHGADGLYKVAAQPLRAAYALLDAGTAARRSTEDRLHAGAGELAISVGWLAHDSGRFDDARSHYAEALATARVSGDAALEAHAFCNTSFLARDAGRYREAVRAAQAGLRAAQPLSSARLLSLLSLREAGAWAGLGDRAACEQSLGRAHTHFARGQSDSDPEWMSFFGEPELEALEAYCWSALGDWSRAARHAHRATVLQNPHFARNLALYRAQLASNLAHAGRRDEAAAEARRVVDSLDGVQSSRIRTILTETGRVLAGAR
jgi:tetratricopeptide (TPR) repeat protein